MSNSNFVIVTFLDEDSLGIVASNWIKPHKNVTYYPNVRTKKMKEKLLRRMVEPDKTWPQYQIKILKRYETYWEARFNLKKAEETSNSESDKEVKRRKRKRKTANFCSSEDSNSSDGYPISKVSKTQKITLKKMKDLMKYQSPEPAVNHTVSAAAEEDIEVFNNVAKDVNSDSSSGFSPFRNVASGSDKDTKFLLELRPDVNSPTSFNQHENSQSVNPVVNCPSGCVMSKQFSIQQSQLVQMVTDLSNQMTELNKKVDLLLERPEKTFSLKIEDAFAVPDFLENLPVKDDAGFCLLNDLLKISKNKQAIIKFLAGIGSKNARSFTTNMLRRIMSDEVAAQYSLTGKQMKNSHKKSFLSTETCKIIFQLCKKLYDEVTEEQLKEITGDWLNQAKVRMTRRFERLLKTSRGSDSILE